MLGLLVCHRERVLAGEALGCLRFFQPRVHGNPLIEHEALAPEMVATTGFEVLQNAAVQLVDLAEAGLLHEWSRLFAPDAAGAKHHDRLLLEFVGQRGHRGRKVTKVTDTNRSGVFKRAQIHFVVVAGVEQGERPAFVEPLLKFSGRKLLRGGGARIDALHAERDDLLLELHEQPPEGLAIAKAFFHFEASQQRIAAEMADKPVDAVPAAGHEDIDALRAEQNRALQILRTAE